MRRQSKWLLAILMGSFLLNVWGIGWGLPERWHPDELTQRAENMVGEPSLNPHYFAYGGFHYYLIAVFAVLPVKLPNQLLHVLDYDAQSTVVILLSRLLSALLGTGVVLLTCLIGERLFDRRTGLFAGTLLATSMILVNLSHFATADVPSLFWFMLGCLMATDVFRGGSSRSYLLAGVCSGLAAAVKYVGGLSIVVLLAAHFLGKSRRHRLLATACLIAPVGFVLGNPVVLFAPFEFAHGFVAESVFNSLRGLGLPRAFVPLISQLEGAVGLPVFALLLAGFAYGLWLIASKEQRSSSLLVFSMVLPYYVAIGSMRGPRAGPLLLPLPPLRYTLPLVPFVSLLAAKLLSDLLAARHRAVRGCAMGLFAVALGYSIVYAAAVDLKFGHDSRYAARQWLLDHVDRGAVVETTSYGPDIPRDRYTVVERPHDNQVAAIAASVDKAPAYVRYQAVLTSLEAWLARVGLRAPTGDYIPWYRKAVLRYDEQISTFDASIQGLESRSPDVLVVSDLYSGRFRDQSSVEATFFDELLSGKTSYRTVAEFDSALPSWIDPPAEFVDPRINIYSRNRRGHD